MPLEDLEALESARSEALRMFLSLRARFSLMFPGRRQSGTANSRRLKIMGKKPSQKKVGASSACFCA